MMELVGNDGGVMEDERHTAARDTAAKICVIFATRGRPEVLKSAVRLIDLQTVKPDMIIVSCVSDEDAGHVRSRSDVLVVKGKPGLTSQRNNGLRHMPADMDFVIFLDDDFLTQETWIAEVLRVFEQDRTVSCITGKVLADGINGPGYTVDEGLALLSGSTLPPTRLVSVPLDGPYGCNMAFRVASIGGIEFDERLVLYGWQEDRDFGAQVAKLGGRIVWINTALGVHLGTKGGRVSGRRLGYSQVINPFYLLGKGTMTAGQALDHAGRNLVSNFLRSFVSEPYVDRFGRLRGNLIGLCDLVRGKLTPERAERL
jgi:GT2 family glycosyltransferase